MGRGCITGAGWVDGIVSCAASNGRSALCAGRYRSASRSRSACGIAATAARLALPPRQATCRCGSGGSNSGNIGNSDNRDNSGSNEDFQPVSLGFCSSFRFAHFIPCPGKPP